ncbi:hypothetical protein HMPREF6123_2617 [Oribacterium sinus F0268]|uniref:Uncharacterized protein n=1 Tax=Oribacterium sinus F0268 TaxID=585501 RepID=C2L1J8_9FIRM|nr:hypothetical protein HMPREF6123_2617 [Oribacterium sinus F0268]
MFLCICIFFLPFSFGYSLALTKEEFQSRFRLPMAPSFYGSIFLW